MYARTELVDKCRKKGYNDSPDEKSEGFFYVGTSPQIPVAVMNYVKKRIFT
jgi:hypothetical protein